MPPIADLRGFEAAKTSEPPPMESRLCAVASRLTPQRRTGDPRDCDKPRTLDPLPLIFVRLHECRVVEPDQAGSAPNPRRRSRTAIDWPRLFGPNPVYYPSSFVSHSA